MTNRPPAREFCAAEARRVGEPLFATASRVDLWLALEVNGAWADEVGEALDPATPHGRALTPVLKAVPRSRVLFIKGSERTQRETLAFYVAVTDEAEPRLYRFELGSYEALEEIDLFGVLAGEARYDAHLEARPLYLVCTHGTHDRCCAKFGFPLFRGLARRQPECVWQSSHVGGDRFAANVVCLPHGLYYGHVDPDDAEAILERTAGGELYPQRLRGRACYAPPVQAAEHFLRAAEGERSLSAYRLWAHRRQGAVTEATFLQPGAGRLHTLRVEPAPAEGLRFLTCGTCDAKPVSSFRLLDHQTAPFAPETVRAGELEYALRPAAMRDYGFIYCLRRETLRCYLDEMGMGPEDEAAFFARFDVTRHRLITVEGTPVGALSVVEREDELRLANLHLLPAHQRRGLGSAVVRNLLRQAGQSQRRVTAQVLKVNPARAFYERLGFRVEGEVGPRYQLAWRP